MEDVFTKVRNGAGYDKEKIFSAVSPLIDEIKKDKNRAIEVCTGDHEGKYLYTLGATVCVLSLITGRSLKYPEHKLIALGTGALLHDIGMVRVPGYIAEKKSKLTPDEYNRIKTHTIYGYRLMMKELDLSNEVASIALQHHEAYDGTGYPRKLSGKAITDFAKIVAICDVFVAMTRVRSYRDEHLSYNAMKTILSEANRKYDPVIIKAFLSNMAIYPVGSIVQLSNSVIGRVVSANPNQPLKPTISVLVDEFGDKVSGEKIIDLSKESLFIKKPLSKSFARQLESDESEGQEGD